MYAMLCYVYLCVVWQMCQTELIMGNCVVIKRRRWLAAQMTLN